ncbi:MAG: aminopeptidase P N-terminal domain-containing protein [Bacteroidales bacterium]|jgi:Xaa-Pro aminopeptidase|nr:aminopeptidase P N-terminal domain-containing protein [Bacteroidales bacterium]MDI9592134.1 aminopeptidase P N-terminal domain-containing protein [Bacteroidota bacterium]MBP7874040.1 aminopeptidase P N-terminal domain-containing protein [Bacteroidales bacterium]MCO6467385.1 aminopeptidase P N-terminal domain-containing protein [Bacteroidales bacterium]MCZ2281782.1 aminopeptidase P N-terminal domain-containing protein [Bacteroidales bacterium]
MRYQPIDKSFFEANRERFGKLMKPSSVAIFNSNDEFIRSGDQAYVYRQNSDFFYLTGINQEKSVLVIAPNHPDIKLRQILFLVETDEQTAIRDGDRLTREKAMQISGIANVKWLSDLELTLRDLIIWSDHVYLNIYEYPKFSTEIDSRDHRFARQLQYQYPAHNYERAAPLLTKLRMVKSETEINLIRKAIEITNKSFYRILKFVGPGVHEFEIQAEMEHEFLINRSTGSAFPPIIAAGKNACVLHYNDNNDIIDDGQLLLIDFGAEYANYAADITRTIPVNGKFKPRQRQLYDLVLKVQQRAIKQMIVGNTMEKYNTFVNNEMEREIIKIGLLNEEEVKKQDPDNPLFKKYFMHGTAHHLGLDVHDVICKYEPFKPGMILTCEPGIYIRSEAIGIRLENNILITENGPVNLSADIPIKPEIIESLMSRDKEN